MQHSSTPALSQCRARTGRPWRALALAAAGLSCVYPTAWAAPLLGTHLATFTVLGASTDTNVPGSSIVGNVGVWSSGGANAVTGFLSIPGVATSDPQVTAGHVHAGTTTGTPNAMQAHAELVTARIRLASLGPGTVLAADLVGLTLFPGVYTVPADTTNLSGALTLDGAGNANAAWIFQMADTLITSPNAVVNVRNTGFGAGVYWNVASSATIDVNTTFMGNILALASITMNTGATDLCGRALAAVGAVTLDQNSLSGVCSGILAGSNGLGGGLEVTAAATGGLDMVSALPFAPVGEVAADNSIPEPGTLALFGLGALAFAMTRRRR